jgi:hypothetical protein
VEADPAAALQDGQTKVVQIWPFPDRFQIPNCRRQSAASKGPGEADFPRVARFRDDRLLAEIRPYAVIRAGLEIETDDGDSDWAVAALGIDWRGSRAEGRSRLWANAAPVFHKYPR